jgi:hypothetical protein
VTSTTRIAAAAALAAIQILMAGCSAGGPTVDSGGSGGGGSNGGGSGSAGSGGTTESAPPITTQPRDATVLTGASATFTAAAGGSGVSYQWMKNGQPIAGATAATYTTPAAAWSDENAQFTVVATGSGGSTTSSTAILRLKLSDDQAAFESYLLATGSYLMDWSLNYTSAVQVDGVNFVASSFAVLPKSPLVNGPQTAVQSPDVSMAKTLSLVAEKPDRVLKDGQILVVPADQYGVRVTYVGTAIQVEDLAAGGDVAAYAQIRTGLAVHPLSGTIGATPDELAHPYNALLYNPAVLDHAKPWLAGANYLTYTAKALGDRYLAFDCTGATYGADPVPCYSNTTLATALAAGIHSISDNATYTSADGTVTTLAGVPVFVATQPRPQGAVNSSTVEYRVYFEFHGNVYTGALIKDGTVLGGGRYRADPTSPTSTIEYVDYQARLNQAARDSLAAAMAL